MIVYLLLVYSLFFSELPIGRGGAGVGEEQSLAELRSGAAKGDAVALRELGQAFQFGSHDLEENMMKAVELYLKAAEKGDPMAINNLGQIYNELGNQTRTHGSLFHTGFDYLNRAAELDVAHAHGTLAMIHLQGRHNRGEVFVEVDYDKCLEHAEAAIRLGDTDQYGIFPKAMGNFLIGEVRLLRGDDKGAFEALTESLRHAESIHVLFHLGTLYFEGRGTERDLKKAAELTEKLIKIVPDDEGTRELLDNILAAIQAGEK